MSKLEETNELLAKEFNRLKEFAILKNTNYGNSLYEPKRVFSKAAMIEGVLIRIDDKLNRIAKVGVDDQTEDSVDDIIIYLIHLNIMREQQRLMSESEQMKLEFPNE